MTVPPEATVKGEISTKSRWWKVTQKDKERDSFPNTLLGWTYLPIRESLFSKKRLDRTFVKVNSLYFAIFSTRDNLFGDSFLL